MYINQLYLEKKKLSECTLLISFYFDMFFCGIKYVTTPHNRQSIFTHI